MDSLQPWKAGCPVPFRPTLDKVGRGLSPGCAPWRHGDLWSRPVVSGQNLTHVEWDLGATKVPATQGPGRAGARGPLSPPWRPSPVLRAWLQPRFPQSPPSLVVLWWAVPLRDLLATSCCGSGPPRCHPTCIPHTPDVRFCLELLIFRAEQTPSPPSSAEAPLPPSPPSGASTKQVRGPLAKSCPGAQGPLPYPVL
jgi:hypothetical protein